MSLRLIVTQHRLQRSLSLAPTKDCFPSFPDRSLDRAWEIKVRLGTNVEPKAVLRLIKPLDSTLGSRLTLIDGSWLTIV